MSEKESFQQHLEEYLTPEVTLARAESRVSWMIGILAVLRTQFPYAAPAQLALSELLTAIHKDRAQRHVEGVKREESAP